MSFGCCVNCCNLQVVSIFQVDFRKMTYVDGIQTQGLDISPFWVTSFKMLYSVDCIDFRYYKLPGGNDTVFFDN